MALMVAEPEMELTYERHLPDLLRELCELRLTGSFCDVVVEVQSRRYLAHKAVLSSTCRYFRSLFLAEPCSTLGPFVLDFVSIKTFDQVLDFVYRGSVRADRSDVRLLYHAAKALGLDCLEDICQRMVPLEFLLEPSDSDPGSNVGVGSSSRDVSPFHEEAEESEIAPVSAMDDTAGKSDGCILVSEPCSISGDQFCFNRGIGLSQRGPRRRPRKRIIRPLLRPSEDSRTLLSCPDGVDDEEQLSLVKDSTDKQTPPFPVICNIKPEPLEDNSYFGTKNATSTMANGDLELPISSVPAAVAEEVVVKDSPGHSTASASNWRAVPAFTVEDFLRRLSVERRVVCGVCGELMLEAQLREHTTSSHFDETTLSCPVCSRSFSQPSEGLDHVLTHATAGSSEVGSVPPSSTTTLMHGDSLSFGHEDSSTAEGEDIFAESVGAGDSVYCRVCGLSLPKKFLAVRRHAKSHVDTEKRSCRVCGRQCNYLSNVIKHALIHIGVCLFRCDICGKRFINRNNLMAHRRRVCLQSRGFPFDNSLLPVSEPDVHSECTDEPSLD
uniref:zinc finger and BTB domain-containing protein 39-like n=1 Tax=Myxine glutinosa TaxID=7769 RepID=UPI00358FDD4D